MIGMFHMELLVHSWVHPHSDVYLMARGERAVQGIQTDFWFDPSFIFGPVVSVEERERERERGSLCRELCTELISLRSLPRIFVELAGLFSGCTHERSV